MNSYKQFGEQLEKIKEQLNANTIEGGRISLTGATGMSNMTPLGLSR